MLLFIHRETVSPQWGHGRAWLQETYIRCSISSFPSLTLTSSPSFPSPIFPPDRPFSLVPNHQPLSMESLEPATPALPLVILGHDPLQATKGLAPAALFCMLPPGLLACDSACGVAHDQTEWDSLALAIGFVGEFELCFRFSFRHH